MCTIKTPAIISEQIREQEAKMEPKFKVGDKVQRKVGTYPHGDHFDGVPFIVQNVNRCTVTDARGYYHYFNSIELVPPIEHVRWHATPKFKAGDKLVCISVSTSAGYTNPPVIGQTYTYKEPAEQFKLPWFRDEKGVNYMNKDFELATDNLDALIETANKGAEARKQIGLKYRNQVRQVADYQDAFKMDDVEYPHYTIIKKAAPVVDPPKLAEGWAVSLLPGEPLQVRVGCLKFRAHILKAGLNALMLGDSKYVYTSPEEGLALDASRVGIKCDEHTLSWASAELLQTYLAAVLK